MLQYMDGWHRCYGQIGDRIPVHASWQVGDSCEETENKISFKVIPQPLETNLLTLGPSSPHPETKPLTLGPSPPPRDQPSHTRTLLGFHWVLITPSAYDSIHI